MTALPSREAFGTEFGKVRDTVRDARVAVGYGEGEGEEGKGVGSAEREHWRVLVAKVGPTLSLELLSRGADRYLVLFRFKAGTVWEASGVARERIDEDTLFNLT